MQIGTINQIGGSWNGDIVNGDIVQINISNDGTPAYMIAIEVHYIVPIYSVIKEKYTMIEVCRKYKRSEKDVEHNQDALMYMYNETTNVFTYQQKEK